MLTKDVETMAGAAQGKADICEHYPVKFFIRAIMAGFFIVVATILSNVSAAVLYSTYPQFGKLLGAFLFSIAIVLIVFIGGELFTGNNMTMAMGAYAGTCTWKQVLKVWLVSYIGNFVGAFFLSFLFVKSGASHQILVDYYNSFLPFCHQSDIFSFQGTFPFQIRRFLGHCLFLSVHMRKIYRPVPHLL
jgi:nitrite transporter